MKKHKVIFLNDNDGEILWCEDRISKQDLKYRLVEDKLTMPMILQLLSYCRWANESGTYYGPKQQFLARHDKIVKWLDNIQTNLE